MTLRLVLIKTEVRMRMFRYSKLITVLHSFTLLSLPTGDDASRNGEGDLERLRRDPRLTTESSLAISAAQESQSILAARGGGAGLPLTVC